jgi:protein phosphatase PTC7
MLDEIVSEISAWEQQWFPSLGGEEIKLPHAHGISASQDLAERLVKQARLLSLDKERDSPFAILAKENDIMWGGGMPDDTTVIVARVVSL